VSVPRSIFSPCPPNVAQSASLKHPYAQSSTACLWKNPIPLSTQSVAAASLTICRTMNVLNVVGKVLDLNSEKLHVLSGQNDISFTTEDLDLCFLSDQKAELLNEVKGLSELKPWHASLKLFVDKVLTDY
jgi:hypothetical protein